MRYAFLYFEYPSTVIPLPYPSPPPFIFVNASYNARLIFAMHFSVNMTTTSPVRRHFDSSQEFCILSMLFRIRGAHCWLSLSFSVPCLFDFCVCRAWFCSCAVRHITLLDRKPLGDFCHLPINASNVRNNRRYLCVCTVVCRRAKPATAILRNKIKSNIQCNRPKLCTRWTHEYFTLFLPQIKAYSENCTVFSISLIIAVNIK